MPMGAKKELPDKLWGRIVIKLKSWPWKTIGIRLGKSLVAVTALLLVAYLWGQFTTTDHSRKEEWVTHC